MTPTTPTTPARATRDRGAVLPFVAILLPVLLIMTAFAVDLGRQRSSRRTMQARSDIIALDMVRLADGRSEVAIVAGDADHLPALQAMNASAVRNNVDPAKITIDWGTWDGEEFDTDATTPNAVKVRSKETIDYFFRPGVGKTDRVAIASSGDPAGCFSIGSFAAGLNTGDDAVLNQILGGLMGSSPKLQALGYDGLASGTVNIADLVAEIGVGSPTDVLNTTITRGEFYAAIARAMGQEEPGEVQVALLELVDLNPPAMQQPIRVGDLISITPGGEGAAAASEVNVLDLVAGGFLLSNGTHALNIPGLGVNLPLVTFNATATLIEALRHHCGPVGDFQSTDQLRLDITASLLGNAQQLRTLLAPVNGALGGALTPVLGVLDGLVGGLLSFTSAVLGVGCPAPPPVVFTITVRAAGATATLDDVTCVGDEKRAFLSAFTSLGTIDIGVRIGGTQLPPLIHVERASDNENLTIISPPDLPQTEEFGRKDLTLSNTSATVLGAALGPVLNPILGPLDTEVLSPLLNTLGLDIAGGDLIMHSMTCAGIRLVG